MALFGNKKELTEIKNQIDFNKQELESIKKNTWAKLESFFQQNQSSDILADINKVGDPYFNNIYFRKAIDKQAAMIAGINFSVVDNNGKPVKNDLSALFNYINEDDTPRDFIYEIIRSLKRFGKCHIKLSTVLKNNVPVSMWILNPTNIKPKTDSTGVLSGWEYTLNNKKITYPKEQVIFIKYKHPDSPYDGIAPGSSAIKEILLDYYSAVYNIKNMKNGAQGKGVWVDPSGNQLTAQQKQEAQWAVDNEFNKGVSGAGESVVLSRNLSWIRTSESNKDMEYITLTNKMRDDILNALDMPKVLFLSAESTFTNLKEAKKMLWQQTLLSDIKMLEDAFNARLLNKSNLRLKFDTSNIPELIDDITNKIGAASQLYAMNVPMSIINESLNLGLPDWEGMDEPPTPSFALQEPIDYTKIYNDYEKQKLIEQEKRLNIDEFARELELQKSINTMLVYEKQMSIAIQHYFGEKYKEVETWLESNPPDQVKSLLHPEFIERFITFIRSIKVEDFFLGIKSIIERTFNQGAYRTYSGIGINFNLNSQRAINHLAERGLKLADSPKIVLDTIISKLSSEKFTIQDLAKEISKTWKEASLTRAKLIAITETTAAYSAGRVKGMQELGINKMQWINSHDSKVRHSHQISDIVPVGSKFTLADGYQVAYPGDGDPAHACNCRCTVVSYLE